MCSSGKEINTKTCCQYQTSHQTIVARFFFTIIKVHTSSNTISHTFDEAICSDEGVTTSVLHFFNFFPLLFHLQDNDKTFLINDMSLK